MVAVARASSHEQAHRDQHRQTAGEAGECRSKAPEQEARRQHARRAEAIRAPAHDRLHRRIGPVEQAQHPADFARGEVQLLSEQGSRHGNGAPIGIIDEERY